MAKIKQNKKNFMIIEMNKFEAFQIWGEFGGVGICDNCNDVPENGFYVAVLNQYLCPKCFSEWIKTAKKYKEDESYEKLHFQDTVHRLKLKNLLEQ